MLLVLYFDIDNIHFTFYTKNKNTKSQINLHFGNMNANATELFLFLKHRNFGLMWLNNGHGFLYLQGTDNNILGIQINRIHTELKRTVFVCFILKTRAFWSSLSL